MGCRDDFLMREYVMITIMVKNKWLLVLLILAIVGGSGYFFWQKPYWDFKNATEAELKELAVKLATEKVKTLERYRYWEERGVKYEPYSVYEPKNFYEPRFFSAGSKPEFWVVNFDHDVATDQSIQITVDVLKKEVVYVFLHIE